MTEDHCGLEWLLRLWVTGLALTAVASLGLVLYWLARLTSVIRVR